MDPTVSFVLVLILIGVALYLVKRYVPMDPAISTVITVVVVLFVVIWMLSFFNVAYLGGFNHRVLAPR